MNKLLKLDNEKKEIKEAKELFNKYEKEIELNVKGDAKALALASSRILVETLNEPVIASLRLEEALKLEPDRTIDPFIWRYLALSYKQSWRLFKSPSVLYLQKAIESYTKIMSFERYVEDPNIIMECAEVYYDYGAYDGALKLLSRIIVDFPGFKLLNQCIFLSAVMLFYLGDYEQSKGYLEHVQDDLPTNYSNYFFSFLLARVYEVNKSKLANDSSSIDTIFTLYEYCYKLKFPNLKARAVSVKKWYNSPEPWIEISELHLKQYNYPLAFDSINQALVKSGDKVETKIFYILAFVTYRLHMYNEAVKASTSCIENANLNMNKYKPDIERENILPLYNIEKEMRDDIRWLLHACDKDKFLPPTPPIEEEEEEEEEAEDEEEIKQQEVKNEINNNIAIKGEEARKIKINPYDIKNIIEKQKESESYFVVNDEMYDLCYLEELKKEKGRINHNDNTKLQIVAKTLVHTNYGDGTVLRIRQGTKACILLNWGKMSLLYVSTNDPFLIPLQPYLSNVSTPYGYGTVDNVQNPEKYTIKLNWGATLYTGHKVDLRTIYPPSSRVNTTEYGKGTVVKVYNADKYVIKLDWGGIMYMNETKKLVPLQPFPAGGLKCKPIITEKKEKKKNLFPLQKTSKRDEAKRIMQKRAVARNVYESEENKVREVKRILGAILVIQKWWRKVIAIKKTEEIRKKKKHMKELINLAAELKMKTKAIIKIQCLGRRYLANKLADKMWKAKKLQKRKERKSAINIQRCYRGHLGRRKANVERDKKILKDFKDNVATKIQKLYRGVLGRRRAKQKSAYKIQMSKKKEKSALKIQSFFRAFSSWMRTETLREKKAKRMRMNTNSFLWEELAPPARNSGLGVLQEFMRTSLTSLHPTLRVIKSPLEIGNLSRALCEEMVETLILGPIELQSDILEVNIALRSNRKTNNIFFRRKGNIGDNGVVAISKALRSNFALQTLFFGSNNINEKGVEHLCETFRRFNYGIHKLTFEDNSIGDAGVSHFSKLLNDYWFGKYSKLTHLILTRCGISDKGGTILGLALNCSGKDMMLPLTHLGLSGNLIGNKGAAALAKGIRKSIIKDIDLSANIISNFGAFEFAMAFRNVLSFHVLDISSNNIGFRGGRALIKAAKERKEKKSDVFIILNHNPIFKRIELKLKIYMNDIDENGRMENLSDKKEKIENFLSSTNFTVISESDVREEDSDLADFILGNNKPEEQEEFLNLHPLTQPSLLSSNIGLVKLKSPTRKEKKLIVKC